MERRAQGPATAGVPLRGRILVVDDEEHVRRLIRYLLERRGHVVAEASNGRVALAALRDAPFDLVITDLQMPEMDGLALLEECRQRYPSVGVILVTAYGSIQSAVHAMKRGAMDYVTKPFDVADLHSKVEGWFERRREEAAPHMRSAIEPLVELHRILASRSDLTQTLDGIVALVRRTFGATGVEVLLYEGDPLKERVIVQSGDTPVSLGLARPDHGQVATVSRGSHPWLLSTVGAATAGEPTSGDASASAITVPMLYGDEVMGAFSVVAQAPSAQYRDEDAQLLQVFVFQMGISILHHRTRQQLLEAFRDLSKATLLAVHALSSAVQTFDGYTHDHSERVAQYAFALGARLGLPEQQLGALRSAGLLHDVGKLGVGDDTLHKNGALTSDEYDRIKLHPVMGAKILADIPALVEVVPIVLHHHERWDGKGYPDHLIGEDIPLGARILSVVDMFDAMTSDRPYRSALTRERALTHLGSSAGTELDKGLVDVWREYVGTTRLGETDAAIAVRGTAEADTVSSQTEGDS